MIKSNSNSIKKYKNFILCMDNNKNYIKGTIDFDNPKELFTIIEIFYGFPYYLYEIDYDNKIINYHSKYFTRDIRQQKLKELGI